MTANSPSPAPASWRDPRAPVLVVDDDPGKRLAIVSVIESLGYLTVEVGSGEEALREVMTRAFAVILMDVVMPGMDGYETARLIRMRRESEDTPIIFITAYARDETQIPIAYASGAVDFIFAPVIPQILRAKVSFFVEMFLKSRALVDARAELEEKVKQLQELDRLKEEFVAVVTHELRTPLTSVAGYLDIVLEEEDGVAPLDEHRTHCVEVARRNAQRLVDLVEDLLLVRGIDSGREQLARVPVELSDLVNDRLESIAPMAEAAGVSIACDVAPGVVVEADERRMAQIVDNLLSNAIKYTLPGGDVRLRLEFDPEGVHLTVTDTGIGIPLADQGHVFDPFFRAANVAGSASPGTGLGLSVTRRLVEAMGGTVAFQTVEDSGSSFTVELPMPLLPLLPQLVRLKDAAPVTAEAAGTR